MKEGLLHYDRLINIKTIGGLAGITRDADALRIGATTTHRMLERSPEVYTHFPALTHLEAHVANVRVRGTGTIGGNLCFAEPHADPGTLLQVYNARVRLARREGARTLAIEALSSLSATAWDSRAPKNPAICRSVAPARCCSMAAR
jgi:carbon-monoxide dehydrogenase medium subunit